MRGVAPREIQMHNMLLTWKICPIPDGWRSYAPLRSPLSPSGALAPVGVVDINVSIFPDRHGNLKRILVLNI